jgi:hypothetical protein
MYQPQQEDVTFRQTTSPRWQRSYLQGYSFSGMHYPAFDRIAIGFFDNARFPIIIYYCSSTPTAIRFRAIPGCNDTDIGLGERTWHRVLQSNVDQLVPKRTPLHRYVGLSLFCIHLYLLFFFCIYHI